MPILSAAYKSALENIGFPETVGEAQQKWEAAWKSCVSGCTQAIATGLSYTLAGAFEPTDDPTAFFKKLESAGKADIASFVLIPIYGTTTPPTGMISPITGTSDSIGPPLEKLSASVAAFAQSAGYTGSTLPPPSGTPPGTSLS